MTASGVGVGLAPDASFVFTCDGVLDGEIAVPDERGITHLDDLHDAIQRRQLQRLAFYAFDLLHLDGHDLCRCALLDRKAALRKLLQEAPLPRVLFSDHLDGSGLRCSSACAS
jgi:bifunctional non-homologous end joining protein LigD